MTWSSLRLRSLGPRSRRFDRLTDLISPTGDSFTSNTHQERPSQGAFFMPRHRRSQMATFLTMHQASEQLGGVPSAATLYRLAADGHLPAKRIGRKLVISQAQLD